MMPSLFSSLKRFSFKQKLSYTFDHFMSQGGGAVLMLLMFFFLTAFFSLTLLRFAVGIIWYDENLASISDQIWQVVLQIGMPAMIRDTNTHYLNKLIGFLTVIAGLVFFSSLVAFITGLFNTKIHELRKGKSLVLEGGHTLVLGFGEPLFTIVWELIIAQESDQKSVIVVLSDHPKEELEDLIKDKIKDFKNTRVVVRTGNIASRSALERVSAKTANSVIILNAARVSANALEIEKGDSQVLKTLMALISLMGEDLMIETVVQIHSTRNRRLAENLVPEKIQTLDDNDILSRILVQTSISTGLAKVYSDFVGFEGNEIYFYTPPQGWMGHSFGKLQFHFIQSILFGFHKPDGSIVLNPHPNYIPDDEEVGILFAEDDSRIHFYHNQVIEVEKPRFFIKKAILTLESQLVVGWNSKIVSLINEFSKYVVDRSTIHLVVETLTEPIQQSVKALQQNYPHLVIEVMEVDIHNPQTLAMLKPQTYSRVIFLAEYQGNNEDIDSTTIARLLEFRNFFKALKRETGEQVQTKLVTEVMEVENVELISETGARDFIIPHQFISKIFAQLSQNSEVKKVYDELFQSEGCTIYLKPAHLYFEDLPVTKNFANCMKAAQMRGEVCLGVRLDQELDVKEENYGIHLLPYKNEIFDLQEGDSFVTLANQRA